MNKLVKVLLVATLCATALVGCKKEASAKFAKAGLGVISTFADGQVNTTFAAVGLDADGKIQYVDFDTAQSTPADTNKAKDQTKEELKEAYGMKAMSGIQKEWFEQAETLEKFVIGKTIEEVKAIEVNEGKPTDADLSAGCTMSITGCIEAIVKAADNAVEVAADSIVLGRTMSNDAEKVQVVTDLVLLALDAEGKTVYAKWDVAQIGEGILETKGEKKDGYGMKDFSGIKKEWYEQAKAFEDFCVGKTVEEIKAIEVAEGKSTDADLSAGCTIAVSGALAAVAKAK